MKDVIHIIGHKNPDTDSICASIAYAELKRALGYNAIACRIGEINSETEYVLKRFNVEEPVYIENAKNKLYDIAFDKAITVKQNTTINASWEKIGSAKTNSLVVVDNDGRLEGLVSMSDVSNILMSGSSRVVELMKDATLEGIVSTLRAEIVLRAPKFESNGNVVFLSAPNEENQTTSYKNCIVFVGGDPEKQEKAINDGVACIILFNQHTMGKELLKKAIDKEINVIKTDYDTMTAVRLIYQAAPVGQLMSKELVTFNNNQFVDDVYKAMSKSRFRSYPVLNNQNKVLGSISRYHLLNHKKKKVILVDHNEMSQSIDNLNEAEVLEIIDHHRIGDVETANPIVFRNQTLGSTCTIIAMIYKEEGVVPTKQIASLLCCAMISDTMNFRSPTTTRTDVLMAKELAAIAQLDLNEVAREMFAAVATLKGRTHSEILYNDFKEYNIEGNRVAIGQINLADFSEVKDIEKEFIQYLKKINTINKFDLLMMCFTNVEGSGSQLVYIGKLGWAVEEAFKDFKDENNFVKGVISRKKQIIPTLSKIIRNN